MDRCHVYRFLILLLYQTHFQFNNTLIKKNNLLRFERVHVYVYNVCVCARGRVSACVLMCIIIRYEVSATIIGIESASRVQILASSAKFISSFSHKCLYKRHNSICPYPLQVKQQIRPDTLDLGGNQSRKRKTANSNSGKDNKRPLHCLS